MSSATRVSAIKPDVAWSIRTYKVYLQADEEFILTAKKARSPFFLECWNVDTNVSWFLAKTY